MLTSSSAVLPYTHLEAVTKSDTVDFAGGVCRALYIGGAGNVSVLAVDDSAPVLFTAPPVGTIIPIQARRVYSTNTTATAIVALY